MLKLKDFLNLTFKIRLSSIIIFNNHHLGWVKFLTTFISPAKFKIMKGIH